MISRSRAGDHPVLQGIPINAAGPRADSLIELCSPELPLDSGDVPIGGLRPY